MGPRTIKRNEKKQETEFNEERGRDLIEEGDRQLLSLARPVIIELRQYKVTQNLV